MGCREQGQALVEFAIVFPVQLLFTLGIMQYALIYTAKEIAEYAAFTAARAAVVYDKEDIAEEAAKQAAMFALGAIHHVSAGYVTFPNIPHTGPTEDHVRIQIEDTKGMLKLQLYYDYPLVIPVINMVLANPAIPFIYLGGNPEGELNEPSRRLGSPHLTVSGYAAIPKPWEN